ncbi:MAG: glycosyltransferase family 39 protein [Phycisphaerae bacterium]
MPLAWPVAWLAERIATTAPFAARPRAGNVLTSPPVGPSLLDMESRPESSCPQSRRSVSVLVPTLNEADNIDSLVPRIQSALAGAGLDGEIVVVDGGSTDGTQARVQSWSAKGAVTLIQSDGAGGLSGDILRAAGSARHDVVVVMDADLSHPPETVPLLAAPVLEGSSDVCVGSRYVKGGGTPDWPGSRRLASRLATYLARPLVNVNDPMSGFFAVRRDELLRFGRQAVGFKIGLEILARGGDSLRVLEVPIVFHDRKAGSSKFGPRQAATYLRQLVALTGGAASVGTGLRFLASGAIGMVLDLALFNLLLLAGCGVTISQVASFVAATVSNYIFNSRWAFAATAGREAGLGRYLRYLVVCVLALFLRGAVLSALVESAGWDPRVAILLGIAAATAVNFVGAAFFIFPRAGAATAPAVRWRVAAICLVGYILVLRLAYVGVMDLIPEEAYYWLYAQHLDIGYLDHPPMVAWLIGLGTLIAGNTELGVRLPAYICWIVAAVFMYHLARNMFGKTSAFRTVLLLAILPIFSSTGLVMTPDAPLYACWAGSLYFLERALLAGRGKAWLGFGLCLGLGLLSKYTIALLVPAAFVFLIADRPSRRWFGRPEPYLAAVIALAAFSPVIVWNATHEWASFLFQGPRRWSESPAFSLHLLVLAALVLLTPVGLMAVFHALFSSPRGAEGGRVPPAVRGRAAFARVFVLVPLAAFVAFSLWHAPKLNWTGPAWLAAIPAVAFRMDAAAGEVSTRFVRWGRKWWMPTAVTLLLLYGGGLYYLILGLPGLPALSGMDAIPVVWQETGDRIGSIERQVEADTGAEPVIVGMDRYATSSELAFYTRAYRDDPTEISGCHLFGSQSLMWQEWAGKSDAIGRNIILCDFARGGLTKPGLNEHFARLGPITAEPLVKNGKTVTYLYWRVGYGYRPSSSSAEGLLPLTAPGEGPNLVGMVYGRTQSPACGRGPL